MAVRPKKTRGKRKQIPLPGSEFELVSDGQVTGRDKETAEERFGFQCRAFGLPQVIPKYHFAKSLGRRWEFDYAFPRFMVAVEIDGISVMPRCRRCHPREFVVLGRHASVTGIRGDREKYNAAARLHWYLLRFEPAEVWSKYAIQETIRVLAAHGWLQEQET